MTIQRRIATLVIGLVAGFVATSVLILFMVVGRYWLGVTPPPEAIPDRIAPTLDIHTFFDLFGKYGGYNGLKKFGIKSGIAGVVGAGMVFSLVYPLIAESRWARRMGSWRFGVSRAGVLVVLAVTLVLWLASMIFLWPVLMTSFIGLPPMYARLVMAGWYLITYVVGYGAVLVATYHLLAPRGAYSRTADAETVPAAPTAWQAVERGAGSTMARVAGTPSATEPVAATAKPDDAIQPTPTAAPRRLEPVGQPVARRAVLAAILGAILAVPSFALIRRLYDRAAFSYDGFIPNIQKAYLDPDVAGITPAGQFYSVTKNVVDPVVNHGLYRLQIFGNVNDPALYSLDDLRAMASTDQETTLECISNSIGYGLISNAKWTGVPLATLLNKAGVQSGAREVFVTGADSYADSFEIQKALDPTTMIVWGMNGAELPQRHGGPVRLIVPGRFGEKNVKWITGVEVVDHDARGFYEQQGWGPNFSPYTRSDIYAPLRHLNGTTFADTFPVGQPVTIRGRAFAGDRGISTVEFSSDGGQTWKPVQIDYPGTRLTWTLWSYQWTPSRAGDYTLVSRAVDGTGDPEIPDAQGTVPQGAHGYDKVKATVK